MMSTRDTTGDKATAAAFASSWNNVREGSVYTREQFLDWMNPLTDLDLKAATVLELGYGNGSLLFHAANCHPRRLVGVELGDTASAARHNLATADIQPELVSGDLCQINLGEFDLVYCIGVLHHLVDASAGFQGVLRHTRPDGRFHCWVYGYEGNEVVRTFVEPLRRVVSRLPWWFTKYLVAGPLVAPFFLYAKVLDRVVQAWPQIASSLSRLPLYDYTRWIAARPFWFFHHVAFDQLVTPQTQYLKESDVRQLLADPQIEQATTYVLRRNGNSWKFGGRKARASAA